VQFGDGGIDPSWHRLDTPGLFAERLISDDGRPLLQHEIWRAVEARGPEGIAPHETREYSFPLPVPPPGIARVTVRLMHRRYQDAFLRFLAADTRGLHTDALEILRRDAPWPAEVPIADGRRASRDP
jgi:hypothetical protein